MHATENVASFFDITSENLEKSRELGKVSVFDCYYLADGENEINTCFMKINSAFKILTLLRLLLIDMKTVSILF